MKRLLDFMIAALSLCILSSVIAIVALLVRLKLGTPVIFKQQRPGLHGKPFYLYKFRTMVDTKDTEGNLLPDEVRLTSFGKLLRKLSVDELPQLINVLKGDISLVGPRPLLMEYLPLYTEEQAKRHDVRPGMTGWAQVNGRNSISWEEKFELDVWYVKNQSLLLDLKILFLTVMKVFRSEGIHQDGHATVEKFIGTRPKEPEKTEIVIIGQGGHSKVIREIIDSYDSYEVIACLDDRYNEQHKADGLYVGPIEKIHELQETVPNLKCVIAIGNNEVRKAIASRLGLSENCYATLIHPTAVVSRSARIGKGTVVMPFAVVHADARISNHAIINTSAIVEHDNIIEDFVHVSPQATLTGGVFVGEGSHIGAGAVAIPGVRIKEWTVIGAGASVISNIPAHCTAVGIPARVVKQEIGSV